MSETSRPCSTRLAQPFLLPVAPASRFAAFSDERAVHHRQESMRWVNGLLNQSAVQQGKVNFLLKLPSVGALVGRAVATQIGEVDFAYCNQNRREEGDEKLGLRFAKPPTVARRLCTISSIGLPIRCCLFLLAP